MTALAPGPRAALQPHMDAFVARLLRHGLAPMENGAFKTPWIPKVDLSETNDAYVVRLEVAGVQKDDLDVAMDGSVLTISGHRDMRHIQEKEKYIWREREDGRFVRVLRLPTEVVEGAIRASVNDGLLTMHLPKAEPAVMDKIFIE